MRIYGILLLLTTLPVSFLNADESPKFTVDANFPCGNIIVDSIKGDTVKVHQDLRDTQGMWFYWAFRVQGAQGRTLKFEFNQDVVGARGPAVSLDNGVTWKWLGDKNFSSRKFDYKFGPEDKSVIFGCAMLYSQATLERFLDANKDKFQLKKSVFCKSKKGRDVEQIQFGNPDNEHKLCALLTCRHHACEMTAAYVIEGLIEEIFSGSETGNWLKNNVDFFWVPFVDKDGVEDGDQGKNRRPHDHNRDYVQKVHPEVRTMMEKIPQWSEGKRMMVCDFHCPYLRYGINEILYFPGVESPYLAQQGKRFCLLLEKYQKNGVLPYKESFNLPFGKDWNRGTGSKNLMMFAEWGATLPNAIYSQSIETCFANASGESVTVETARELGHHFAKAMCEFLKEEVAHPTRNESPMPWPPTH